jgi:MerR family transcriptional regulator, light-induced transcriptional regulator
VAQYNIKELEHLSGIKAHTIRIWEQRYSILCPNRTVTNIRYYTDADLKTLLNVSFLNERGYKISKIAKMQEAERQEKVQQFCEDTDEGSSKLPILVSAMIDMDEQTFDKAISTVTLQIGFMETMRQLVYPFLNKIGILWQTNNITPAHEHFVSNLIRQKIIVAIDGQVIRKREDAPTYLLYLPEGELHEITLLYMNYIIRSQNFPVVYLGQHLPFEDLELTYEQCKPQYICTVLTSMPERDKVQDYLYKLSERFSNSLIYVYGQQVQQENLIFPENICCISNMNQFTDSFK